MGIFPNKTRACARQGAKELFSLTNPSKTRSCYSRQFAYLLHNIRNPHIAIVCDLSPEITFNVCLAVFSSKS